MTITPEQIAAANKANLDALVGFAQQAFKGMEQLVELNLAAGRSTLDETAEKAKAALNVKEPQELLNLQVNLLQPAQEKAVAYGKQVADIAASTQAEITKLAEAQLAQAQAQFKSLVDAASKNAPAGSESAVAAVANAAAAFDSVQKAAKQAASVAESNFKTLTASAESTAKAASEAVKKSAKRA